MSHSISLPPTAGSPANTARVPSFKILNKIAVLSPLFVIDVKPTFMTTLGIMTLTREEGFKKSLHSVFKYVL